ncbi:HEXXH motif-containing putative peptide modification protein [Gallaecimonas kandeliae]|uniref:aKG-HExxH-type peptide beta-hydroxylase n=1 Tax=Gallaecimonas kandeliae TaxID=3029055 RepID=UPI0026498EDB|nr:HEXXH motif-containing putative peptide modification protein [Gallaecimonas kandeliae]WKE65632.1 HEXXH motif-containing putative peptide modification protein [Gallaecimonas kandeliae]
MAEIPQFSLPVSDEDNIELVGLLSAHQLQKAGAKIQKLLRQFQGGEDVVIADALLQLERVDPGKPFWRPEVGCLLKAFGLDSVDWETVLELRTQFLLTAYLTGLIDDLSMDFECRSGLLLQGKILPPGHYRALACQNSLEVLDTDGSTVMAVKRQYVGGRLIGTTSQDEVVIEPSRVGYGTLGSLNQDFWSYWVDAVNCPCEGEGEGMVAQVQEALALADRYVPQYGHWIRNVLHEVVPIQRPAADTLASASIRYRFGAIEIACPASPFETLEMLIHECSHQYFNLAFCLESLVTEDAPTVYSPLKDKERPLFLLLTGYHAFGNVMLAYSSLRAAGLEKALGDRDKKAIYYMRELSVGLEQNRQYLTELGMSLYQPLREALLKIPESELMDMA